MFPIHEKTTSLTRKPPRTSSFRGSASSQPTRSLRFFADMPEEEGGASTNRALACKREIGDFRARRRQETQLLVWCFSAYAGLIGTNGRRRAHHSDEGDERQFVFSERSSGGSENYDETRFPRAFRFLSFFTSVLTSIQIHIY